MTRDLQTEVGGTALICAPIGKDAKLLQRVVELQALPTCECKTLRDLAAKLNTDVGLLIVTEETLDPAGVRCLGESLRSQPAWSDIPLILLSTAAAISGDATTRFVESFAAAANISILERPVRIPTLSRAVRSALLARRRQYQLRDLLLRETQAGARLQQARDELERRVAERTDDLLKTNSILQREVEERQHAENVLRNLSGRVMRVQDDERRRIARDLHDGVGQFIAATGVTLALALNKLRQDPSHSETLLREAQNILKQCEEEVRTVSYLCHPPLLDENGLASAVQWYVEGFSKRSNVQVNLDMTKGFARPHVDIETAIFRIIQEGLTNIHRHSGAGTAWIDLKVENELISLSVRDDGKGMPLTASAVISANHSGVGVAGMRERVRQLGGAFHIECNGVGTALRADIPFRAAQESSNDKG